MSLYYKYEFISPAPLLAQIAEELKSYLDTGAIDQLIWPIYLGKCLDRLGRGSYRINQGILNVTDYQAILPDDFDKIREAWACTSCSVNYQLPSAVYENVRSCSTRLDTPDMYCDKCRECESPDIINVIYKTTNTVAFSFKYTHLLKPGNINARKHCADDCANFHSSSNDSFDIRDNKFVTNFREGIVYILYYSKELTDDGYQLIPDNLRIKDYIEAYIKAKVFEQLSNQVTDETYTQIQNKADRYKQAADEAYNVAVVECRLKTVYDKHRDILQTMNRFNKYLIR